MSTATAKMPSAAQFEEPVESTNNLPPLAILGVGDIADFAMREVAIVVDEENPKDRRVYYRGILLKALECTTKLKGAEEYTDVSFEAGTEVTIPGSGSLDYTLGRIANKEAGASLNNKDIKWSAIEGHRFIVERLEDDKLKEGKHKGKPVKTYKVMHSRPKAK